MKMRLLLALTGLAIGFAVPAFSQQTNTPDPQLRERLLALIQKYSDAENNNDATALAALYTEDAVEVTDRGPVNGRQAIEKLHADDLQKVHVSNHLITVDQDSPHIIATAGNEMWATGGWSETIQGKNFGPIQIKGYWEWREDKQPWARFIAPKGFQDSAQGFNPGNHPMKSFALKGRELAWAIPAPYRSREGMRCLFGRAPNSWWPK